MKRYLITGASRGIGRAIAETLAADDAELLLHGRDTVALEQTRKAVEPRCAKVVLLIHDLAKPSGVSDLIAEVGKGPIDLLVNKYGVRNIKIADEMFVLNVRHVSGICDLISIRPKTRGTTAGTFHHDGGREPSMATSTAWNISRLTFKR